MEGKMSTLLLVVKPGALAVHTAEVEVEVKDDIMEGGQVEPLVVLVALEQ
jgi:hypothetical protein